MGQTALRQRLAADYQHHNGDLDSGQVAVTNGAKHAMQLALKALVHHGKKCLCPLPGWEAYHIMLQAYGAEIIDYDPLDLEALIVLLQRHPGAVVILNYPHNPSGKTLTEAQMGDILHAADLAGSVIISDEVYRRLIPGHPSAARGDIKSGKVMVADSLSKWCSAAGLRLGWLLASNEIIEYAARDISLSVSGVSSAAQVWALTTLERQDVLPALQARVKHSTAKMAQLLRESGYRIVSQGGMYLWVAGGAEFTIGEVTISGLPGAFFGRAECCRICATGNPDGFAKLIDCWERSGIRHNNLAGKS